MPHLTRSKHGTAAAAALTLALVGILLAACGGSSSTTGSTASASASRAGASTNGSTGSTGTTTPAPGGAGGFSPGGQGAPAFSRHFAKLRECLAKSGVTLPKRARGQRPAGGFLGGAGPQLPKGVSRAQYDAALKKCGGTPRLGRAGGSAAAPRAKEALTKFAACMRANGVDLPAPNTSGKGPIFNTSSLNVAGSKFKAAESKCAADLRSVFPHGRGAGRGQAGTPPGGGA